MKVDRVEKRGNDNRHKAQQDADQVEEDMKDRITKEGESSWLYFFTVNNVNGKRLIKFYI